MNASFECSSEVQVSLVQGVSYALPTVATFFLVSPIAILQGIYAKHFGLQLTTIATVIFVSRLFDAISDPMIGYLSDRYSARTGTRKPIIVGGGILLVISSYFLYVPPEQVKTVYFLCWFLVFYLAWTLFEVPHLAWGGELATNSQAKTKIYSLRNACTYLGNILFFAVPLLPFFDTNEFTPETLEWAVLSVGVIMLPLLYVCITSVPNGSKYHALNKGSYKKTLTSIYANKPLLIFLGAYLFTGAGVGMWFSLMFIFVDGYLGLGDKLSTAFLLAFTVAMLGTGVWYTLARRLGKKLTWGLGMVLISIAISGTALLQPGEESFTPLLIVMIVGYIGFSSMGAMAPSLLADIVDYGVWRFGTDSAGTYFSAYTLVTKANFAIGGALGLSLAGWYGFDPTATEHSDESVFGLKLAIAYIPAITTLASVFFVALVPINTHRHGVIRRRLESREARANTGSEKNNPL